MAAGAVVARRQAPGELAVVGGDGGTAPDARDDRGLIERRGDPRVGAARGEREVVCALEGVANNLGERRVRRALHRVVCSPVDARREERVLEPKAARRPLDDTQGDRRFQRNEDAGTSQRVLRSLAERRQHHERLPRRLRHGVDAGPDELLERLRDR